ncbi:carbon storage regulator [Pseudomonas shirazensis]|uniref:carbon storage regulator n=1 Tax=Pseudomonas shirazensis TaxID=2745494 RepID=UPI0039874100
MKITLDLGTCISIDNSIKIRVISTLNNYSAKLALEAPKDVLILRSELQRKTPK